MAERYVLDTSAILTLTDQEEGAAEVERLLDAAHAYTCEIADALIAAVGKLHHATLVHKDPEFEALAQQVSLLNLPYKTSSDG